MVSALCLVLLVVLCGVVSSGAVLPRCDHSGLCEALVQQSAANAAVCAADMQCSSAEAVQCTDTAFIRRFHCSTSQCQSVQALAASTSQCRLWWPQTIGSLWHDSQHSEAPLLPPLPPLESESESESEPEPSS